MDTTKFCAPGLNPEENGSHSPLWNKTHAMSPVKTQISTINNKAHSGVVLRQTMLSSKHQCWPRRRVRWWSSNTAHLSGHCRSWVLRPSGDSRCQKVFQDSKMSPVSCSSSPWACRRDLNSMVICGIKRGWTYKHTHTPFHVSSLHRAMLIVSARLRS